MLIDSTKHEALFIRALVSRETKFLNKEWQWNNEQSRWEIAKDAQSETYYREHEAFEAQLNAEEHRLARQLLQRLWQQYVHAHAGEEPTIVLASDTSDANFGWVKQWSTDHPLTCPDPLISEQSGQKAVRLRMTETGQLAGQVQLAYYIGHQWQTAKLYFVRPQVTQTMAPADLIDHCRRHERSLRLRLRPNINVKRLQRVVQ